jgi:integrase
MGTHESVTAGHGPTDRAGLSSERPPIKDYRGAWNIACELAKVVGRIPHDFRRTAVRNLERAGVPQSVAVKLTGHKTERVYPRYEIVSEADLSDGLRCLAALHDRDAKAAEQSRTVTVLAQS